jgi:hypothetical protein
MLFENLNVVAGRQSDPHIVVVVGGWVLAEVGLIGFSVPPETRPVGVIV